MLVVLAGWVGQGWIGQQKSRGSSRLEWSLPLVVGKRLLNSRIIDTLENLMKAVEASSKKFCQST